ncbi:MAG: DUF2029 domain-containing protein, partial [Acidobacteriota bacterium]|nr:DUF2029 domain-containing protein [Acidobacteriota bacterium]
MIAREPERLLDFAQVRAWAGEWLQGASPYESPESLADYPPNALVSLAPLASIPAGAAVPLWIAVNVALSLAIAAIAPRLAGHGALHAALLLMLPPFRTLNQFSIAAFAPALAGVASAARRPVLGGVAIGLSLIKPQVGGPALLWAIAARRWRTVAAAVAVPIVLVALFSARLGRTPFGVLADHAAATTRTQNRADLMGGETNLLPLVDWLPLAPVVTQAILAVLLLALLPLAWRKHAPDRDARFFASACLVSLLALRHLGYGLLLAIPALLWTIGHASRRVRAVGWICFAVMVASPPTLSRYLLEPSGAGEAVALLCAHAYRPAVLALFILTLAAPARTGGHGATI